MLSKILKDHYKQILGEDLTEAEEYEAQENLLYFYNAVVEEKVKQEPQ